jgi:hypothetical protein
MEQLSEVMITHPHLPEKNKIDWKYDLLPNIGKGKVTILYAIYLKKVAPLLNSVRTCRAQIIDLVEGYDVKARHEPYTFFLLIDWDTEKTGDFFDVKDKFRTRTKD